MNALNAFKGQQSGFIVERVMNQKFEKNKNLRKNEALKKA